MPNIESDKSTNDSLEALFDERALLYDDKPLPEAGKTTITPVQGADPAAAVDGGKGDLGPNSTASQGLHVSSSLRAVEQFSAKFGLVYTSYTFWVTLDGKEEERKKEKKVEEEQNRNYGVQFPNCKK